MFENIEDLLIGFFVDSEANKRLVITTVRGLQHVLDPASGVPLHRQYGMHGKLDCQILASDGCRNRIDQEWHVIVDHFDKRIG